MKKGLVILAAVMLLAALALPLSAMASANDPGRDAAGTLMAVSAKRVTIQTTTGTSVTLKIKAATRITVDDHPARVSDLKIGQSVDAHYKPATMVATLIDVQRSVP